MNYRCRFCGYRFKDKDEQICPECLTAREEDITCGVYGEDEHSHAIYDDRYGSSHTFAKNDTFRDGKADFLRAEMRYEDHTAASRYERRNGGDISMEMDDRVRQSPYKHQQPYAGSPSSRGYAPPKNNTQQNKGCGKGCGVFLAILILLFMLLPKFPDLIEPLEQELDKRISSTDTDDTAQSADIDTSAQLAESPELDDLDAYLVTTDVTADLRSDDDSIGSFSRKALSFVDNGEFVSAEDAAPRDIRKVEFDIRLVDGDGDKIESDNIDITLVELIGFDEDQSVLSRSDGVMTDNMVYSVGKTSDLKPVLYVDKNAVSQQLTIEGTVDGKYVTLSIDMAI